MGSIEEWIHIDNCCGSGKGRDDLEGKNDIKSGN